MTNEEYQANSIALLKRIADILDSKPARAAAPSPLGGAVFPNYGTSKGAPVAGAAMKDLEFYANGARRSLADPSKSRFHAKEQALLTAIEAEIAKQTGGSASAGNEPPPGDEDAPF